MMWFIAYLFASGLSQIYLIWFRRPFDRSNLSLTFIWQFCNLFAFWAAVFLAPVYGGAVIDGKYHTQIFGINENILAFGFFSLLWLTGLFIFRARSR